MRREPRSVDPLVNCHGYLAIADDGWLGTIETPLFGSDSSDPDYLVVRAQSGGVTRRALVPASLVRGVDVGDGLVRVQGKVWELSRLPNSLPVEGRSDRRG